MFKNRLDALIILFGLGFLLVLGRLWQLQVFRHDEYRNLLERENSIERIQPSLRGPITDRYGFVLAEDRPSYDLSVRIDSLKAMSVTVADYKTARESLKENGDTDALAKLQDAFTDKLEREPFVTGLAAAVKRPASEIAGNLGRAFDRVARNWQSPKTAQRILSGIDQQIWIALSAAHQDAFYDNNLLLKLGDPGVKPPAGQKPDAEEIREPPFPGLVCTYSSRRIYPHGRMACFVTGAVGEIGGEEEESLRHNRLLIENCLARNDAWNLFLDRLSDSRAEELAVLLGEDPRKLNGIGELYETLARMNKSQRDAISNTELADALKWLDRPPRMTLSDAESIWMDTGLRNPGAKNSLPDRIIGEMGAERYFNDLLRGKSGVIPKDGALQSVSAGNSVSAKKDGGKTDWSNTGPNQDYLPRPGDALTLTLSATWQAAAEHALRNRHNAGAIVVIDVNDGGVLALASYPDFDPNTFVPPRDGRDQKRKIRELLTDPAQPLINRAIAEQYPLGSVMKGLVGAIALEYGSVNVNETFECKGFIMEGGQKFHCDGGHAHGTVNLYKGLRCSCNVTFHQIGARVGVERLGVFARLILGKRSGIDLPGEVPGVYPDAEWRNKAFPKNPAMRVWTKGNDYQLAIGQGMMTSTVLQAAVLTAAIANGGHVVTPHISLEQAYPAPISLGIKDSNLAHIREGLEEVVNVGTPGERGTAYTAFHEGVKLAVRVAGKTSTAEHGKNKQPHAWFAGYAPANNPKVAFAVILEEVGHGGTEAAPLAVQMLRDVYGTKDAPVQDPGGPDQLQAILNQP